LSSFPCDLKSEEGILDVSRFARERETHLDILISNAGIRRDPSIACNPLTASLPELQTSLLSSSYTDWLSSFQVNTMAHYFLSVSLLDLLAAAGERTLGDGTKGKENGCGVVVVTRSVIFSFFFLGLC
jgi:NAD(P)-dependent dehydrogenase (short-subunit alcohol dehydrogenase family)